MAGQGTMSLLDDWYIIQACGVFNQFSCEVFEASVDQAGGHLGEEREPPLSEFTAFMKDLNHTTGHYMRTR